MARPPLLLKQPLHRLRLRPHNRRRSNQPPHSQLRPSPSRPRHNSRRRRLSQHHNRFNLRRNQSRLHLHQLSPRRLNRQPVRVVMSRQVLLCDASHVKLASTCETCPAAAKWAALRATTSFAPSANTQHRQLVTMARQPRRRIGQHQLPKTKRRAPVSPTNGDLFTLKR